MLGRLMAVGRLVEPPAIDADQTVAADHRCSAIAARDGDRFRVRQPLADLGRARTILECGLVDPRAATLNSTPAASSIDRRIALAEARMRVMNNLVEKHWQGSSADRWTASTCVLAVIRASLPSDSSPGMNFAPSL